MVEEENADRTELSVEPTSEEFGNTTSIQEVFDDRLHPLPWELEEALVATGLLTEKEAFAFVNGSFEAATFLSHEKTAKNVVQENGFEGIDDFWSVEQRARQKVGDALWIGELLEAYRSPDFPDECQECGRALGGMCVGHPDDEDSTVRCFDCAGVEIIEPDIPESTSGDSDDQ
jgi:hypothetical protein